MALDENVVADLVKRKIVTDTFRRLPADKKERVYRTAVSLFGKYGYDGLAVDQLCRQAGISKGSFFQYFPSKMHLLEFAILVFDDYLAAWVAEVRRNEKAVLARDRILYLYQALAVNTKLFRDQQRFYLFVTNAIQHAAVALEGLDLERHLQSYVDEIIHRGVQTGEIRADYEVALTGHLVSMIIGALLDREYGDRPMTRHQTEEYLVSFLFDGIKA